MVYIDLCYSVSIYGRKNHFYDGVSKISEGIVGLLRFFDIMGLIALKVFTVIPTF